MWHLSSLHVLEVWCSMDGTSKDRIVNGSLFRPVSLSMALDQFTPMIYDMICRRVRIVSNAAATGVYSILVYGREGRFWAVRPEDYDKCLVITRKFTDPNIFPSSIATTLDIIRSYIAVEFAERRP